ncbi:MAG TPA: PPE family protein [Mycobacterium sp.]|nr:PPE family protein [Mycobacterium sp.]
MGSPPEVHSALLAAGPGAGALLAAAGAWSSLSVEYAAVAQELVGVVGSVGAGVWQGVGAESYVAAHVPYLGWLARAGADSAAAAAQCEVAAAGYVSALAAMPTLPELAANHAVHSVLLATNFFGINTVPIAVNEADYARMWVQAATVMGTYEVVAGSAVASVPHTDTAPNIVEAPGHDHDHDHGEASEWDELVAHWLRSLTGGQVDWDPTAGTVNGVGYDSYTNPGQLLYWVVRALEFSQDFQHFGDQLLTNPAGAFQYLVQLAIFDWPTHIAQIATWLGQSPLLVAMALGAAVAPAGAAGLAGLGGLAALPQPVTPILAPPTDAVSHALPALGTVPPAPAVAGSVAAAAPAPAVPASAVAGPAPALAAPPAAAGAGFVPPYLIGGPGIGSGSGMGVAARSARKAVEPDIAGAAAAAREANREETRARRRRRAAKRDHGDQFMTMGVGVDPDWRVSDDEPVLATDRGAGTLGFAGNAAKAQVGAAGMTRLADSAFGSGPKTPMVPGSWGADDPVSR